MRPARIAEEIKKREWALVHPPELKEPSPEHHVLPKEWRLWLWAAALAVALFILAPKLGGDRVTALFIICLVAFVFLLALPLRNLPWILAVTGKNRTKRICIALGGCIALTVALGWVAWPIQNTHPTPPVTAAIPPDNEKAPTLIDLFAKDVPYTERIAIGDDTLRWKNEFALPVKRQLYLDFQAKSYFVGFYVPSTSRSPNNEDKAVEACVDLANHVNEPMTQLRKDHQVSGGTTDQMNSLEDLTFSGRVLIYHEDFFSIVQKADIIKAYKAQSYDVQFRGPEWLSDAYAAWFHRQHPNGLTPR